MAACLVWPGCCVWWQTESCILLWREKVWGFHSATEYTQFRSFLGIPVYIYQVGSLNEYRLGSCWEEQGLDPKPSLWGWCRRRFSCGDLEVENVVFVLNVVPLTVVGLKVWICLKGTQLKKVAFVFKTFHVFSQLIWVFTLPQQLSCPVCAV